MRVRYFSFLVLGQPAGFLAMATPVYALPTIDTLALGFGVGMLAVSLELGVRSRKQPWAAASRRPGCSGQRLDDRGQPSVLTGGGAEPHLPSALAIGAWRLSA